MHPSSALKRKTLRRYFLTRYCLHVPLSTDENSKITEISLPIRTQLCEPLPADKTNGFKMFIGCLTIFCHVGSPSKLRNTSIESASFRIALGVWHSIYLSCIMKAHNGVGKELDKRLRFLSNHTIYCMSLY